ncbi:MAG: Pseudouridine synthase [Betaproteobacteria bacterium]|jgi:23S rRNA pseudouridine2605 synthase|nr:Pseudouridine synthase [Betaproteobacteria bacterium]MEA3157219.1 rRNA synthase [Betaproteobacteria bacterium]
MAQRTAPKKRTRGRPNRPLRPPARKAAAAGRKTSPSASTRSYSRTGLHRPPLDAPSQKLHKVLAQAGIGSRRMMEEWIREGKVTVNGAVAAIGARVVPSDTVKIGRRIVRWPGTHHLPRVLVYHKPEGEIVSHDDPEGRASVFERLPQLRGAKWLAVGRLDYNTSGLLLFTTSGELANRMMHPRFAVEREYAVRIVGQLNAAQLERLTAGIDLSDGIAKCESVQDEGGEGTNHWYRIVLREGRNRVVRRIFESLGLTVSRLMRVRFGVVALPPRLKRGQVSPLPASEVKRLLDWLEETAPQTQPAAIPA